MNKKNEYDNITMLSNKIVEGKSGKRKKGIKTYGKKENKTSNKLTRICRPNDGKKEKKNNNNNYYNCNIINSLNFFNYFCINNNGKHKNN